MAIAKIQLPDGRIATVEVPDGMSEADIQRQVGEMWGRGDFGDAQQQPMNREGFYAKMREPDTFMDNALDVAGEAAAAANRSVTGLIDTVPNAVNAGLSLAGSKRRVPTLTGSLDKYGIQGGFMEPGNARSAVQAAGSLIPAAGAMVPIARPAAAASSLAADFVGAGASKTTPAVIDTAANALGVPQRTEDAITALRGRAQNPRLRKTSASLDDTLSLKRREANADTFGLSIDDTGTVFKDPAQKAARKQGVDESVVTMVRDAPQNARLKMRKMLDIVDGSRKNAKYAAMNRPGDVVGDSITARTRVLATANRVAGRQIDEVAKSLQGRPVDVSPAVDAFERDLASMGITRSPESAVFQFDKSDIGGLAGPTRVLNGLIKELQKRDGTNAYVVHQMKRWIDEMVSWGKAGEGLSGRTERVLKSLRHNLDATLDAQFPEYNRVNTMYSETIQALDALQTAAGKRIDLTGKNAETALGTLSRRVLGNQVSRQDLVNGLDEIDRVARKVVNGEYAGTQLMPYRPGLISEVSGVAADELDDGLIEQVRFVSQLEELFGTNATNSFLGDNLKAADRVAESAAMGETGGMAREGIRYTINKVRGINEENALKSLRELLK